MNPEINLILTPLEFYSSNDEDALFEWIGKNKCIQTIKGTGKELHLVVSSKNIPDNDLRDLLGLCMRYQFGMKQLAVFLNDSNRSWFYDNKISFWHEKVFGEKTPS